MTFLLETSMIDNYRTYGAYTGSFIQGIQGFMCLIFKASAWIGKNLDEKPVHFELKGNSYLEITYPFFGVLLSTPPSCFENREK